VSPYFNAHASSAFGLLLSPLPYGKPADKRNKANAKHYTVYVEEGGLTLPDHEIRHR
jgi:hypothetical protein